jgi:hypothetical protein
LEWDHHNRDKLDNRRGNIRAITHAANTQNSGLRPTNSSGVIGVSKTKKDQWYAQICYQGKVINLGRYDLLEDAIKARKEGEEIYRD